MAAAGTGRHSGELGAGDVGAVKRTIQRLREGYALNMYPEGSRSENGGISPLQKGVVLVVRRAGVPVVPAVIVGSFEAWPRHRSIFRPHPIRVQYGPRMGLAGLEADKIMDVIDRTLRRCSTSCVPKPTPRSIVEAGPVSAGP